MLWEAAGREGRAVAGIEEGWGWRGGVVSLLFFPTHIPFFSPSLLILKS